MKRLFLDTNIVLDLLGERHPFYMDAAQIATLADREQIALVVSPLAFATVHYLLCKYESSATAINKLRKFSTLCEVSTMGAEIVSKSLSFNFADFEDAMQYFSANASHCEIIITRNGKDFKESGLPVMTAGEFLASL